MTAVRFWTGVVDQPGKAALAAATALFTSSTVQQGASAITAPVLESVTGMCGFVVCDFRHSLSTQYLNLFGPCISVFSSILFIKIDNRPI